METGDRVLNRDWTLGLSCLLTEPGLQLRRHHQSFGLSLIGGCETSYGGVFVNTVDEVSEIAVWQPLATLATLISLLSLLSLLSLTTLTVLPTLATMELVGFGQPEPLSSRCTGATTTSWPPVIGSLPSAIMGR